MYNATLYYLGNMYFATSVCLPGIYAPQRVPGHRSGCGDCEMGTEGGGPGGGWGRYSQLHWNSYCVYESAHNTSLVLFVFVFNGQVLPQHTGCHVLPWLSRNTGQIDTAGFQSLKHMYYIHVIMIIKWFWLWLWLRKLCKPRPLCHTQTGRSLSRAAIIYYNIAMHWAISLGHIGQRISK